MSDTASMTVKMGLDGKPLKEGLDNAKKQGKDFAKEFEHNLRETKGAVKDVSGTIEGLGRAFDGSVQGAISGFKDLLGLIETNPWLAFAAAAAAAFTAIASKYDELTAKILEGGKKASEAMKSAEPAYQKSRGIKSEIEMAKEGSDEQLAKALSSRVWQQFYNDEEIRKAELQRSQMQSVPGGEALYSRELEIIGNRITEMYKERKKIAEEINTLDEETAKRSEKESARRLEIMKQGHAEAADAARKSGEQAEAERRIAAIETNADAAKYAATKSASEQMAGLEKLAFSSRYSADQYARVGGQIGGGSQMSELRIAEKQLREMERGNKIMADMFHAFEKAEDEVFKALRDNQ